MLKFNENLIGTTPLRSVIYGLAFFGSLGGSLPAIGATETVEEAKKGFTLEEITVTATRRTTDVQSTSIAVSAFTGGDLKNAMVVDMRSVAQFAPNLFVGESGGAASTPITIRGVGDNQLGLGGDGSIAIYVDGVYQGRPYANVFDLVNVDRLEILRGPQGTLYGRNATGGAINVISRSPGNEIEMFGDIRYGNYNAKRIRAGVLGPLVENKLYGGLSVSWSDRDGYAKNLFDGKDYNAEETLNFQGELRFTPTDNLDISWRGDMGHNNASLVFYSFIKVLDPATFPFFPSSHEGITERDDIDVDHVDINSLPPFEDRKWGGTSLTIKYDAPEFTVKSITAYRENSFVESTDADGTSFNFALFTLSEDQKQYSQDLVFNSNDEGRLHWVAGMSFYKEETEGFQRTEIPLFGAPVFVAANARNETEAYAGYLEISYDITEQLSLTAGIRYSDETKNFKFTQTSIGLNNIPEVTGELGFNSWTPRFALNYQMNDDVFLYLSATKGFKSGGFSAINPVALATSPSGTPDTFGEETITSYEFGAKTEWLEHRLRLNIAAFIYDYNDLHTNATDALGFAKVVPAEKADIAGAELEMTYVVTDNLLVRASGSFLDTEYDAVLSFADGLGGFTTIDLTGNKLPRSPEFTFSVGMEYTQEFEFGSFKYSANMRHVGDSFLTESNDDRSRQQAYEQYNASIAYVDPSEKYSIVAFINNISDVQVRAFSSMVLGSVARGMITPPRTYGVELRFKL